MTEIHVKRVIVALLLLFSLFTLSTCEMRSSNTPEPEPEVPPSVVRLEVTTGPKKTTYFEGEKFSPAGMVVTAFWSNNSSVILTDEQYTYAPSGSLSESDTFITIFHGGKKTTVSIIVNKEDKLELQIHPWIFIEDSDGTDDGVERLIASMESADLNFYRTSGKPDGLISSNDVVLLKVNCQWNNRGGTNTDLVRSVIQSLLDHPDGFTGEIIVADNGQKQYGPASGGGGSLSWPTNNNAADITQSNMVVINQFKDDGYKVTGVLWDDFTKTRVEEFSKGDMKDGFVKDSNSYSTGWQVSYAKFTTEYGTHVSFKEGIWNEDTESYSVSRLKVINMPVAKHHTAMQFTASLKSYFGTVSFAQSGGDGGTHGGMANGGFATQMVKTRMPILNIVDMIYIAPNHNDGPRVPNNVAKAYNKIGASTDPVALDYWIAKYVFMPESNNRAIYNPDSRQSGHFGRWLEKTYTEFHNLGFEEITMDEADFSVYISGELQ